MNYIQDVLTELKIKNPGQDEFLFRQRPKC